MAKTVTIICKKHNPGRVCQIHKEDPENIRNFLKDYGTGGDTLASKPPSLKGSKNNILF